MDKVFFVKNGELEKIWDYTGRGWEIKAIYPIAEPVACANFPRDFSKVNLAEDDYEYPTVSGDIYAYIVVTDGHDSIKWYTDED